MNKSEKNTNSTSSQNSKRAQSNRAKSGVVISGTTAKNAKTHIRRVKLEHLPAERDRVKERQRRRTEAEWNRGIIRTKVSSDRIFLALVLILLCLGTVMVFSASYPSALASSKVGNDGLHYIKKQLIFASVGIVVMLAVSAIPYKFFRGIAYIVFVVVLVFLVAVLIVGTSEGEAKRWLGVPNTTISFQPSELMKPALVLVLAAYIDKYREHVVGRLDRKDCFWRGVIVPLAFIGVAAGLVLLEKHLSGTVIIAAIGLIVMVIGGSHIGYTALTAGIGGVTAITAFLIMNPYAMKRITTFGNESADVLSDKWQTTQGLYAIGSGGIFGVGLGGSRQKFSYVSEAQNDFIFTIWCEEMGLIGAVAVILLFLALVRRGFKIAAKAPDTFSALTVYGIMTQIGLQMLLNIAVVADCIPNTGISLPFFSYGGSSLLILMAEMGVVLSISKHSYQKREL